MLPVLITALFMLPVLIIVLFLKSNYINYMEPSATEFCGF